MIFGLMWVWQVALDIESTGGTQVHTETRPKGDQGLGVTDKQNTGGATKPDGHGAVTEHT